MMPGGTDRPDGVSPWQKNPPILSPLCGVDILGSSGDLNLSIVDRVVVGIRHQALDPRVALDQKTAQVQVRSLTQLYFLFAFNQMTNSGSVVE